MFSGVPRAGWGRVWRLHCPPAPASSCWCRGGWRTTVPSQAGTAGQGCSNSAAVLSLGLEACVFFSLRHPENGCFTGGVPGPAEPQCEAAPAPPILSPAKAEAAARAGCEHSPSPALPAAPHCLKERALCPWDWGRWTWTRWRRSLWIPALTGAQPSDTAGFEVSVVQHTDI